MPLNQIKVYNQFLELPHLNEPQRAASLRAIFNRDIESNDTLAFRTKKIRPIKNADGQPALDVLFDHLTKAAIEIKDSDGKIIKKRSDWDDGRCLRLHWVKHHIEERKADGFVVFSYIDRIKGRGDVPRTYLYDQAEQYVVVLEPYTVTADYYLITAFHLTKDKGGTKQIAQKLAQKLDAVL
ncbi:hypothetical protein [Filimonas effusa]|uniref:Restriction endonuclease n=1 Tax=Filimonas effusa TaxID=2508721 RepID=A0A4Q1D427_9BACT|nr:hypothetical protein [Filimonas effusa]RXK81897.1 hypothetical protein ESB13_19130 [Filimonas effusa]